MSADPGTGAPAGHRWGRAQEAAAQIIDRGHLRRFTRDAAFEREVLELFRAHVPASLARLRSSRGRSFRDAAHAIKGSAAAIGAWRLAHAAERAESGDGDDPAAREEAIAAVCAAAAEICRHIAESAG
jgi:HPt (histidine-containing phosphotransfer) domain-containing protein